MGIPRFAAWLFKKYPSIVKKVRKGAKSPLKVDNLYIDMNGIFHPCASKVFRYGDGYRPLLRQRTNGDLSGKYKELNMEICLTIDELFEIIQPQKYLVLCVDGIAGFSKQCQQRSRRFRSVNERSKEDFDRFDSNQISPGTVFMDRLMKYIDWWIRKKIMTDERWRKIRIVFSTDKTPGEGEHKLINFIRTRMAQNEQSRQQVRHETHCIHGLDADLFMLSLGTHLPHFYLFREDISREQDGHLLIDIGQLNDRLIEDLTNEDPNYNEINIINDFIVLCFLVGNDFLPHSKTLDIFEGGIETMIDIYKDVQESDGYLTSFDGEYGMKLNLNVVEEFFIQLGELECEMLERRVNDRRLKKGFPDPVLYDNLISTPDGLKLQFDKFRETYYTRKLHFDMKNGGEVDVKKLCSDFIWGMQWVGTYYSKGMPCWDWLFPYHYAPLLVDLGRYIKDYKKDYKNKKFNLGHPLDPFAQLLAVLPPASQGLLPKCFHSLFISPTSPIIDFYPTSFVIDQEGCHMNWEGTTLLPFVDKKRLLDAYQNIVDKYKDKYSKEFERNKSTDSTLYYYSPKVIYKFRNYNGDIHDCRVKTHTIKF